MCGVGRRPTRYPRSPDPTRAAVHGRLPRSTSIRIEYNELNWEGGAAHCTSADVGSESQKGMLKGGGSRSCAVLIFIDMPASAM